MKVSKQPKLAVAAWHPDFRILDTLPDTKLIRTSFLVNAVAVTVLLLAVVLFVRREQEVAGIRDKIGTPATGGLQKDIAENRPRLEQFQKLQKEFAENEARLKEVDGFVSSSFVVSEFLVLISRTTPRLVAVEMVELSGDTVRLRGFVVGSAEKASERMKAYIQRLKDDPGLSSRVSSIRDKNVDHDAKSNRMNFEIEMKAKPRT